MSVIGLVIPCFKESTRLPKFLPALLGELATLPARVVVQVVDDGSGEVEATKLSEFVDSVRNGSHVDVRPVLRLPQNIGKGGTVHSGWNHLVEECDWLAFVDADGAVPADETRRLLSEAIAGPQKTAWFASRVQAEGVERSLLRDLVGFGFRLLTHVLVCLPVRDTQCGLKALPTAAYQDIRADLKRRDFAFDIELALTLHQRGYTLRELPIHWREQPGGHVRARHAFMMAMAVLGFGIRRWFGSPRR
ncbi:MAG: glycosyltransferase [Verrucomicrobiales bacterium]